MNNVKQKVIFQHHLLKMLYLSMDCVEDETWRKVNTDLSLIIRQINSPVCKDVGGNIKKQIEWKT